MPILSLRDLALILAERGVAVTHESIRLWCAKFGSDSPCGCIGIGRGLDILVHARRNGAAAKK